MLFFSNSKPTWNLDLFTVYFLGLVWCEVDLYDVYMSVCV